MPTLRLLPGHPNREGSATWQAYATSTVITGKAHNSECVFHSRCQPGSRATNALHQASAALSEQHSCLPRAVSHPQRCSVLVKQSRPSRDRVRVLLAQVKALCVPRSCGAAMLKCSHSFARCLPTRARPAGSLTGPCSPLRRVPEQDDWARLHTKFGACTFVSAPLKAAGGVLGAVTVAGGRCCEDAAGLGGSNGKRDLAPCIAETTVCWFAELLAEALVRRNCELLLQVRSVSSIHRWCTAHSIPVSAAFVLVLASPSPVHSDAR